jgi:hypothetical protein
MLNHALNRVILAPNRPGIMPRRQLKQAPPRLEGILNDSYKQKRLI